MTVSRSRNQIDRPFGRNNGCIKLAVIAQRHREIVEYPGLLCRQFRGFRQSLNGLGDLPRLHQQKSPAHLSFGIIRGQRDGGQKLSQCLGSAVCGTQRIPQRNMGQHHIRFNLNSPPSCLNRNIRLITVLRCDTKVDPAFGQVGIQRQCRPKAVCRLFILTTVHGDHAMFIKQIYIPGRDAEQNSDDGFSLVK